MNLLIACNQPFTRQNYKFQLSDGRDLKNLFTVIHGTKQIAKYILSLSFISTKLHVGGISVIVLHGYEVRSIQTLSYQRSFSQETMLGDFCKSQPRGLAGS